jgi:hypothetical protein
MGGCYTGWCERVLAICMRFLKLQRGVVALYCKRVYGQTPKTKPPRSRCVLREEDTPACTNVVHRLRPFNDFFACRHWTQSC